MYKFLVAAAAAAIVDAKVWKATRSDTTSPSGTCTFEVTTGPKTGNANKATAAFKFTLETEDAKPFTATNWGGGLLCYEDFVTSKTWNCI